MEPSPGLFGSLMAGAVLLTSLRSATGDKRARTISRSVEESQAASTGETARNQSGGVCANADELRNNVAPRCWTRPSAPLGLVFR
ncbi:hypothetical protein AAFF_G00141010 [Aldrovandia affinis]|uniref:Secreted protein n=1 Tax=Aldrovandia affinis TaxID=143900 RepID=A0AAD7X2S9_9TELE|nr:hypothetical protein AAFF_G00141010 [Aldrovandia affinis]